MDLHQFFATRIRGTYKGIYKSPVPKSWELTNDWRKDPLFETIKKWLTAQLVVNNT